MRLRRLSVNELLVLAAFVLLLVLTGCAAVGGKAVVPETPRERIAAGWIAISHVYTLAERLYKSRDLSADDARTIINAGKIAEQGLQIAEQALAKGDTATLEAQLGIVEDLLRNLRDRLAAKEKQS